MQYLIRKQIFSHCVVMGNMMLWVIHRWVLDSCTGANQSYTIYFWAITQTHRLSQKCLATQNIILEMTISSLNTHCHVVLQQLPRQVCIFFIPFVSECKSFGFVCHRPATRPLAEGATGIRFARRNPHWRFHHDTFLSWGGLSHLEQSSPFYPAHRARTQDR